MWRQWAAWDRATFKQVWAASCQVTGSRAGPEWVQSRAGPEWSGSRASPEQSGSRAEWVQSSPGPERVQSRAGPEQCGSRAVRVQSGQGPERSVMQLRQKAGRSRAPCVCSPHHISARTEASHKRPHRHQNQNLSQAVFLHRAQGETLKERRFIFRETGCFSEKSAGKCHLHSSFMWSKAPLTPCLQNSFLQN